MPLKFYDMPHLNKVRDKCPQIKLEDIPAILVHFRKKGISVVRKKMPLNTLKPSQKELNHTKIVEKLKTVSEQWRTRTYICGRDKYIADGHHDYAQGLQTDPEHEVIVYKVNIPTKELIRRLNLIKLTKNKELTESEYKIIASLI